ncbi:MAG: dioxygenase [Alphaproteobacteria bacterium]
MRDLTEANVTDAVIARIGKDTPARVIEIMTALVRHAHAFAREVRLTPDELLYAARFIQRVGQISNDKREEGVLLGDVLGLTTLVEAMADNARKGATESSLLGPFYRDGAPFRPNGFDISFGDKSGEPAWVEGRVTDPDGKPLEGVILDLWQTAPNGFYEAQVGQTLALPDYAYRAKLRTDADGRYSLRTTKPVEYPVPTDGPVGEILLGTGRHPWRPAHLHFLVLKDGYQPVQTELFNSDDRYLDSDAVFGVKASLVVDYVKNSDPVAAKKRGFDGPHYEARYDFTLKQAAEVRDLEAEYKRRASMRA